MCKDVCHSSRDNIAFLSFSYWVINPQLLPIMRLKNTEII